MGACLYSITFDELCFLFNLFTPHGQSRRAPDISKWMFNFMALHILLLRRCRIFPFHDYSIVNTEAIWYARSEYLMFSLVRTVMAAGLSRSISSAYKSASSQMLGNIDD